MYSKEIIKIFAIVTMLQGSFYEIKAENFVSTVEIKENNGLISVNDISLSLSYINANMKEFFDAWKTGQLGESISGNTASVTKDLIDFSLVEMADDITIYANSILASLLKNKEAHSQVRSKGNDFQAIKKVFIKDKETGEYPTFIMDPVSGKAKFDLNDPALKRLFDQLNAALMSYSNMVNR